MTTPLFQTIFQEKKSDGWVASFLGDEGDSAQKLYTSRNRIDELWSLFEYYYAISSSRDRFLRSKGIKSSRQRLELGSSFSSYITQSRNFFSYAFNSDYRSSALLYYYAFLNLAKAKIIIERPDFNKKESIHGLKCKNREGPLSKLSSNVSYPNQNKKIGVFTELYNLRFHQYIKSTLNLPLLNLLGYSTDIAHEYDLVTQGQCKISPVKYVISIDKSRKKTWPKLAIHDWDKLAEYKKTFKKFGEQFYKISESSSTRQRAFSIDPRMADSFDFFESRIEHDFVNQDEVDISACNIQLKEVFENYYQTEVHETGDSFQLVEPFRKNYQIPMDEITAVYVVMHHLSELVRYDPESLEKMLSSDTEEGWLLKNFIETAPYTFLPRMFSWITGEQYYLVSR